MVSAGCGGDRLGEREDSVEAARPIKRAFLLPVVVLERSFVRGDFVVIGGEVSRNGEWSTLLCPKLQYTSHSIET